MAKNKEPRYALLPPLTTDEFVALKADIKANGVREPVIVDEDGEILDGHHRHRIDKNAPRRTLSGMTDPEKQAFVFSVNLGRRNLSPSQKQDARKTMMSIAKALKKEDQKTNTDGVIGRKLGVARETVRNWFISNGQSAIANTRKSNVKVNPKEAPVILDRVEAGESQEQVAADYGVTQGRISQMATKEKKHREAKTEREKIAKTLGGKQLGIITGDFREAGRVVKDNSVDLIFTDPPYDKAAAPLYADLAEFAARVLRPGGWCLAYSGRVRVMEDMQRMAQHLTYGWIFACIHSGGCPRFRNLKLQVGWKPILGFYKPPLDVWWNWFADSASGGREKDLHEWQQSESEAAHFIEAMSPKNGLICDPLCGGGTTPAAAKRTGRQWIAFEIDKDVAKEARRRIHGM